MVCDETMGAMTFKEMEQHGWHAKAPDYGALAGNVTVQTMDDLLDAAKVTKGTQLLDVACGPGYGAGAAAGRGAKALGIDFAEAMVLEARRNFPNAEFQLGDGENLSFSDNSFDAVVCPFGLLHMPEPEKAVREAFRVLRRGGRYAFSVWTAPSTHEFFALVLKAIEAYGDTDVPLPAAPSIFRFSDHGECKSALEGAGFIDLGVMQVNPIWQPASGQQILDMVYKSTVRTAALLKLQPAEAVEAIHNDILARAKAFKTGDTYRIAWPAVIAWGSKP